MTADTGKQSMGSPRGAVPTQRQQRFISVPIAGWGGDVRGAAKVSPNRSLGWGKERFLGDWEGFQGRGCEPGPRGPFLQEREKMLSCPSPGHRVLIQPRSRELRARKDCRASQASPLRLPPHCHMAKKYFLSW